MAWGAQIVINGGVAVCSQAAVGGNGEAGEAVVAAVGSPQRRAVRAERDVRRGIPAAEIGGQGGHARSRMEGAIGSDAKGGDGIVQFVDHVGVGAVSVEDDMSRTGIRCGGDHGWVEGDQPALHGVEAILRDVVRAQTRHVDMSAGRIGDGHVCLAAGLLQVGGVLEVAVVIDGNHRDVAAAVMGDQQPAAIRREAEMTGAFPAGVHRAAFAEGAGARVAGEREHAALGDLVEGVGVHPVAMHGEKRRIAPAW